jgi:hypothetical protein
VYDSDKDVEELSLREVKDSLRNVPDTELCRTPRLFSRDSWLVVYKLGAAQQEQVCIVHRTVGDFQSEAFGCNGCAVVVEGDDIPACDHVIAIKRSLTVAWNREDLMAPTPKEPEYLRTMASFRRVYGVYVISGFSEGKHPIPAGVGSPGDLSFDPRLKFRVRLAVLSDFHGTYQIVTGNLKTSVKCNVFCGSSVKKSYWMLFVIEQLNELRRRIPSPLAVVRIAIALRIPNGQLP